MTKIIASSLKLPIKHVTPDSSKPIIKPGQTERPENTQLSTKALRGLGIDLSEEMTFEEWWKKNAKATK